MPAPGDQHHHPTATANPFEEAKPHVNEYTAQEIATLQSRLEKQLGPEYISSRPGASGQKVHYLAAEKCINLANEVFGFNGWSSGIQQVQIDFVDESPTAKISLGLSVIVRVSLRDGTFHEDIGYGHIENCKGKAAAFEKAKKEGTTDALKRALRNFGNVLGNCIYDKEYLARVTKVKTAPSKWDVENLHRHPDFAPLKKECIKREAVEPEPNGFSNPSSLGEAEDEYGGDDFDEVDFSESHSELVGNPDEVALEPSIPSEEFSNRLRSGRDLKPPSVPRPGFQHQAQRPSSVRGTPTSAPPHQQSVAPTHVIQSGKSAPQLNNPQTPINVKTAGSVPAHGRMAPPQGNNALAQRQHQATAAAAQKSSILQTGRPNQNTAHDPHQNIVNVQHSKATAQVALESPARQPQPPANNHNEPKDLPPPPPPPPPALPPGHEPPIGFYTARVAEELINAIVGPLDAPAFNPHLESPSIRKTSGVDHTKSKPVNREIVGASPPPPVGAASSTLSNAAPPSRTNFVSPQVDMSRKIGMPGAAASPLHNRNSYKPPQMKRPAENGGVAQQQLQRPPLGDVTNQQPAVPNENGGDIKRPRLTNP